MSLDIIVVENAGAPHVLVAFASTVIGARKPHPDLKLGDSNIESTSSVVIKSKTILAVLLVDLKTFVDLGSLMFSAGKKAFSLDAVISVCS
jgi:hypothetical protein